MIIKRQIEKNIENWLFKGKIILQEERLNLFFILFLIQNFVRLFR